MRALRRFGLTARAALTTALALGFAGGAWVHGAEGQGATVAPATTEDNTPFPFEIGGPFALVDHTGTPRTDADFGDDYMLVFFGYTSCDGICPVGLQRMAEALDRLGAAGARVQPLFITVDPENDTPAAIATYVAAVHPRLIGLTGSVDALDRVAKAYRVRAQPIARTADGRVIISHGTYIYLMGPGGAFLTLLPPILDAEAMAATIRRYLL